MYTKFFIIILGLLSFVSSSAALPDVVSKKGKYGLMDPETGKIILKIKYDSIYGFDGDYALIKQKDKYGVVGKDGKIYISCKYRDILFPCMRSSSAEDYFWVSKNGETYCLESDSRNCKETFTEVFYGPDREWYGKDPDGGWINIYKIDGYRPVKFRGDSPQISNISNGYTLFNDKVYDSGGKLILDNVRTARKLRVAGCDFLEMACHGNETVLLQLGDKTFWHKKSSGLNGVYSDQKRIKNYYILIKDERMFRLSPMGIQQGRQLFYSTDCSTGLSGLLYDSEVVLPLRFNQISVDVKGKDSDGGSVFIVTLNSKDPVSEAELGPLVELLKQSDNNFVIVSKHSKGKSLFGSSGAEVVHNTLEGLSVKDGFLFVESEGRKRVMSLNNKTDLSDYDECYRQDGLNLYANDIIVEKDGNVGLYVDGVGEVIPPMYSSLKRMSGYIYVYDGDLMGLYDEDRKILDPVYSYISVGAVYLKDRNYYFARKPDKTAVIVDHNGEIVVPAGLINGVKFLDGDEGVWCPVYKNGRMGILDLENFKVTVPCAYEDNIFFGRGEGLNRLIGVYKSSPQSELIEIWTMGGKKLASKSFHPSARYQMKAFLEYHLGVSLYYDD